ncbi:MAG: ATP-dependent RecD-like DNA helicase [Clostridia bacterium]|nr:ATP-dependent RecD-like DNA helicase [Clostridia bacterium]
MPIFECVIEEITFRNETNGWTVAQVRLDRERLAAVGVMPFVGAGEHVRLTGEWTEHPEYGRQIKVSQCESIRPATKSGMEKYLASGLIKGVGPSTARLIIQHFGVHALDILESEPERLIEIPGIGPKRVAMIAESFKEQMEMRNTMMFLQQYDISPALSMKIYRRFGDRTQEILKSNPYRLVDDVPGVGFKTADRIALSIGIAPEAPERLASGLRYALGNAATVSGHVYLPREALIWQAKQLLGADEDLLDDALRTLLINRSLVSVPIDEVDAIYLPAMYEAEIDVARRMAELIRAAQGEVFDGVESAIDEYEREEGVTLCLEQREGVTEAVTGGVTIITGGPGTGKTTGIKCVIRLMARQGEVLLTAPTGRAAKRMSEATGCPAKTIHRLLEFSGEEGRFARNEDNQLKAKMVIVDEMSMVDLFLMRSLLKALKPGTRLVMVGDADQLPSVGAGNVLGDLIDSGVAPVVRLTQIFRQAGESMIIRNAHRINHGEMPIMNGKGSDFFIERRDTLPAAADSMIQLVSRRLPEYMGFDPLRDIQVLSPTKKGDIGVQSLNRLLQDVLNPAQRGKNERVRGETRFRVGDKVMQVRNNYQLEWIREGEKGVGVFNGDMGFITGIDPEEHLVEMTFDDEREAEYDDEILEELELAYCVSVHKSQGSEFPAVVMPVWNWPPLLMTRNLFYTAVTRAKKLVVLVGRESCVARMVSNNQIIRRYSALSRRLIEAKELIQ